MGKIPSVESNRTISRPAELQCSNEDSVHFVHIAAHDSQEPLQMVSHFAPFPAWRYNGNRDAYIFIGLAGDCVSRTQQPIQVLLAYLRVWMKVRELRDTPNEHELQLAPRNPDGAIAASGALVSRDPLTQGAFRDANTAIKLHVGSDAP